MLNPKILSLCILETDHLAPDLVELHTGYGRMFEVLFDKVSDQVECHVFNVVDGVYPPENACFDAWLITGSKADAFSDEPWIKRLRDYVIRRYQAGDVLLGVCFGHQLIARALGGEVGRAKTGWGIGVQQFAVVQQHDWMQPELGNLALLMSHQDQVNHLPNDATVLAASEYCPYAAFVIGDQVLCVQGHPEFEPDYASAIYERRQTGFSAEAYRQALDSLSGVHDGEVFARWILNFARARARSKVIT